MKEQITFLRTLFGGRKMEPLQGQGSSTPIVQAQSRQVVITSYSQPHVLQQKMKEEKMTHGETVTANISPVRLEKSEGKMIMYFCPMKNIEILETIMKGDGSSIPAEVKVEGLQIPDDFRPGFYTLNNVLLSYNGTMQVKATHKTTWKYSPLSDFTSAALRPFSYTGSL